MYNKVKCIMVTEPIVKQLTLCILIDSSIWSDTVKTLYNDIHYSSKILYNVNSIYTNVPI